MRRPHIADRRSRTSLATTAPVQPGPHRVQKTSPCEVFGCHPNNFAEHRRSHRIRSWHRISSEQRGIAANSRFARLVALSGATSCANRLTHARICRLLQIVGKLYRLCGGEGGIRTPGAVRLT